MATISDTGNSFLNKITLAVENEIKEQAQVIIDKYKKQAGEEIEALIKDAVTKTALRIAKYTQISEMRDRLIIEIADERRE